MSGHAAQVPPAVADYFNRFVFVTPWQQHPVIVGTFTPGTGWRRYSGNKRITKSWTRNHLRPEGVTSVAVAAPGYPNRVVDFTVREILR